MSPDRAGGASGASAGDLREGYEGLRREVLDRRHEGPRRWGRALLQSRGMAAWAKAWQCCATPSEGRRPLAEIPRREQRLPPVNACEVVQVLAGMVLALQQEAAP